MKFQYEYMQHLRFIPCDHCGDSAVIEPGKIPVELSKLLEPTEGRYVLFTLSKKHCCIDCFLEITTGRIPQVTYTRSSGPGTYHGDENPLFDNIVRALEENR